MTRTCSKCNSKNLTMMGQLVFTAPSAMEGNLTKKNVRSSHFKVYAVLWDTVDFICDDCAHVMPSAVKRLEDVGAE